MSGIFDDAPWENIYVRLIEFIEKDEDYQKEEDLEKKNRMIVEFIESCSKQYLRKAKYGIEIYGFGSAHFDTREEQERFKVLFKYLDYSANLELSKELRFGCGRTGF